MKGLGKIKAHVVRHLLMANRFRIEQQGECAPERITSSEMVNLYLTLAGCFCNTGDDAEYEKFLSIFREPDTIRDIFQQVLNVLVPETGNGVRVEYVDGVRTEVPLTKAEVVEMALGEL